LYLYLEMFFLLISRTEGTHLRLSSFKAQLKIIYLTLSDFEFRTPNVLLILIKEMGTLKIMIDCLIDCLLLHNN